ncbi:hypothetical protein [Shewanella sp. YLB-07]|uniref:hypothetical protein n=1 Tax=Shewanella sp. YLB-07 TaxID=2601268 RepID=UPI00128B5E0C|nr:hypothetical protein [Shewanella sp. YLB-07]MPY25150.1 hypothetical protein [Shewanella sp. YLB-07]
MKAVQMQDVKTKNDPNCRHTNLSKEYHLGSATGDFICDECKKAGFGRNWPEQARKAKEQN